MKNRLIILLSITLIPSLPASSQSVVGFWTAERVMVGSRDLTPVAKWFKINKDGTVKSGNGWTQKSVGTWTYNSEKREFLPASNNFPAEYGAFKVNFSNNKMFWERVEDGIKVTVTLSEINEMPKSPADSISGRWDLETVTEAGLDITQNYDSDNIHVINIGLGKTYSMKNPDGTESFGYWHMDSHNPEFHLIDFKRDVDFQVFNVSFKDDLVIMKPKKNEDRVFTYKRK